MTKAGSPAVALGLAVLLAGCGAEAPLPEAAVTDSAPAAAAPTLAPAFDPGAVQPGDTVLGLVVISKDVQRAAAVDSVWVGNVVFEGDLVVQGVYQPHYDWPEVTAPCFHVTDPTSIARIPRFVPDEWTSTDGKTWFCFSNPEIAVELLGAPEEPRELVIALSRFQLWRQMSDAYSMAELAELIEAGPASRRTLLDP
ncbi:MAG: hypothetical protein EXR95_02580 [Gemmatimonadetes bacterium]|nr:hypothetical protein [Gemmatimonadota bacterium]